MRSIKSIKNLKGKTVMMRVDFNVPIKNGVVEDDFRIKKALPSIRYLRRKKAKIILITHLGKGGDSLAPVAKILRKFIRSEFVQDTVGNKAEKKVEEMQNGDVILLENLRNNKGEQKADKVFAKSLARFADIYVNEAFPVSHREDASIILLPKILPAYAGLQFFLEVQNLSRAFKKPEHPFLFILGGAKFSTKIPLIKKYLKIADQIYIAGALANDFFKAKGYEVGKSLIDDKNYGIEKFLKNKKLILPADVVIKSTEKSRVLRTKPASKVKKNENILDIGKTSVANLALLIEKAKLILWNGPLGKYEEGGDVSTKKALKFISHSRSDSIIGGGDTVALISQMRMEKKFTFVSTGGGATLDFLADGSLPGIKALG